MLFVQRDPTTQTGSLTYDGDTARVSKDGQVVVDWTSGGTISGIPQGDGYTLEIDKGGTVTDQALAVGIVVTTMGQSNMAKWFEGPSAVDAGNSYQLQVDGSWGDVSGTAAREFADLLGEATGAPIGVVSSAVGSSVLENRDDPTVPYWLDGPDALYDKARAAIDSIGGTAEFALWAQGENDTHGDMTAYAASLSRLFGMVEGDFGAPSILIQEIGLYNDAVSGINADYFSDIRSVQDGFPSEYPYVSIGASTVADSDLMDNVHLDGASRALAAAEMALSAIDQLGMGDSIARLSADGAGDPVEGDDGIDMIRGVVVGGLLEGNGGSDIVIGGNGDDTITGGAGDDLLIGGTGTDGIDGGDGNDVLGGGFGNDRLTGDLGDDELWGGHGDDIISGAGGNDLQYGDDGDDTLDGGDGDDILTGGTGNDTIAGGDGHDTLYGNDGVNRLDGGAGDDFIYGDGQDTIIGGTGDDIIQLTAAPASIDGGDGNDSVRVTSSMVFSGGIANVESFLVYAGAFADFSALATAIRATALSGTAGGATILGGTGNDIFYGSAGADDLSGGGGDDTLTGATGDSLSGGAGNDYIMVSGTPALVDGGAGTDKLVVTGNAVFAAGSLAGIETYQVANNASADFSAIGAGLKVNAVSIVGGGSAIVGTAFADTLKGGAGNDTLTGGKGDTLQGGAGDDFIAASGVPALVDGGNGNDTLRLTGVAVPTAGSVTSIEAWQAADGASVDLSALGAGVTITLLSAAGGGASVTGTAFADTIVGGAGDDTLAGGAGGDKLIGGGGIDTASYAKAKTGVTVNLGTPSRNSGDAAGDGYVGLSGILGSAYQDVLTGDANANTLQGGSGDDTLIGSGGSDVLIGGAGNDTMTGGSGDDSYYVINTGDIVNESADGGNDTIYSTVSYSLHGRYVETMTLTGGNAATLTGNDQANTLTGNGAANTLVGAGGNDVLDGGAGADTMNGGDGGDTFYVDNGGDNVIESSATGGDDAIISSVSYSLKGRYVETLALTGAATAATGNNLANTLSGDDAANLFDGSGGSDTLTGGGGADTFAFSSVLGSSNIDTITDFAVGEDMIQLDRAIYYKAGAAGMLSDAAFAIGTTAATADQRIIYDPNTGDLFYDADGTGAGAQVQFAILSRNLALTAGSFTLVG